MSAALEIRTSQRATPGSRDPQRDLSVDAWRGRRAARAERRRQDHDAARDRRHREPATPGRSVLGEDLRRGRHRTRPARRRARPRGSSDLLRPHRRENLRLGRGGRSTLRSRTSTSPSWSRCSTPRGPALRRRAADARHRPGARRQPRLLMIDEMSLGLAPVIVERLLPVVRDYAHETGAASSSSSSTSTSPWRRRTRLRAQPRRDRLARPAAELRRTAN